MFQQRDIAKRVAFDSNDIRIFPGLNRAEIGAERRPVSRNAANPFGIDRTDFGSGRRHHPRLDRPTDYDAVV